MFFWNSFSFFYDPVDVGNLISGSSAFSKSTLNIWKFTVMYYGTLAWRILSISLLACEMSASVQQFEQSFALPLFGIGIKTAHKGWPNLQRNCNFKQIMQSLETFYRL